MPTEQWRPISGWSGYEVSDHGRVRSYRKPGKGGKLYETPHLLSPIVDKDGYCRVNLRAGGGVYKIRGVHQLVAENFLEDSYFEDAIVLHGPDPSRSNNSVGNLRWGTHAENQSDRAVHGTIGLTRSVEEVLEIKRLYAMGFKQREIARVFRTSQCHVHELVTGKKRKDAA